MYLLGIDIGTSNIKGGLFSLDGYPAAISRRANQTIQSREGYFYYDTDDLWTSVTGTIFEVIQRGKVENKDLAIAAIGIASMGEAGLLIDLKTGKERTPIFPWFDTVSTETAEEIRSNEELDDLFFRMGIRPSFKFSLMKILWLRSQNIASLEGAVWLSVADYIAYRLTGVMATDYSLASRTYAFNIIEKKWDNTWLKKKGIDPGLFPEALPSGSVIGIVSIKDEQFSPIKDIPVVIAGHDHVCGAYAVNAYSGGVQPELVFDSIGTAESLIGAIPEREIGWQEYQSGLSFGCHTLDGYQYWLAGQSTSGASLDWLRGLLAEPALSFDEFVQILDEVTDEPTGIIFYPYLSGSGSPHTDPLVRGALFGLDISHKRAHLIKAVLEGTAYEMEFARRSAEAVTRIRIDRIITAGGGARINKWMQIRADISGCQIDVHPEKETTLLGAALLAGVGSGVYASQAELVSFFSGPPAESFYPDLENHKAYRKLFEDLYLKFQEPIRGNYRSS